MESDLIMLEAPALSARRVGALIDPGAPTATEPGACSSPRPPGVPRPSQDKTFSSPTAVGETPGSSYQLHEDNNTSVAAGQRTTRDEPLAVRAITALHECGQKAASSLQVLVAKGTRVAITP
ncbi:hypothetical protein Ctob_016261 [Chrysochromulina tobinii]|uniref:Uncharacterized protein n=1 Tax=Chrysochromulina tobinii TaxID=1460289 RepID=A0A0M0K6M4_9EUKA|nr:hypothetical protein Ctob_016261 [Chrysochromulina tobinii]|eukprot:KOO34272.1 hypothetical protein Ctob_016261 [Chrysochromulina sp. CCMP291]